MGSLPTPGLDPQVENVVKVDVRQEWRSEAAMSEPYAGPTGWKLYCVRP
jgi:hypothetical protein